MESTWNVVHECDTEDSRPACWTKKLTTLYMGNLYGSASTAIVSLQSKQSP